MNVWSAPIVMSVNSQKSTSRKRGGAFMVLCALLFSTVSANAQESAAQSLYGVKEILVRPVHFDDAALAKSCRLDGAALDATIMSELKSNALPVVAEAEARPSTVDTARIILVPQIVPFNSQGLDCVTWVALSAESRNHLRVLPVEVPRIINIVYWREGTLITSATSIHDDHVNAALHNMIHRFGQSYTLAQPPTVGYPTAPAPR